MSTAEGGVPGGAGLVYGLEWRRARTRLRLFAFNVSVPLLLVLPVSLGGAPPQHAAAVYAVLFVLFGTFGSAIPALRDGETGLIGRLARTATGPRRVLAGRVLAGATLDTVQLLPAALVICAAAGTPPVLVATVVLVLALSLLVANLVGLLVAAAARSVAEGALFAAVVSLLLLHASGVFRTPQAGTAGAFVERVSPYRALHETLFDATAGTAHAAPATALVASALLLMVVTTAAAPRLLRRLG